MKKNLLFLTIVLCALSMNAQVNQIGNTGYVGIGTNTPLYPLEVYGPTMIHGEIIMDSIVNFTNNINMQSANVNNNMLINGSLQVSQLSMPGFTAMRPAFIDENGQLATLMDPCKSGISNSEIPFWEYNPGIIYVDCPKDVKVGIGTDNPEQNLDVRGKQYISNALGIGITEPKSRLDVKAKVGINSVSARFFNTLTGLSPQTNDLIFVPRVSAGYYNSTSDENDFGIFWNDNRKPGPSNGDYGLTLAPVNSSLINPGIRIGANGYLGIGKVSAQKRVEVANGGILISGTNGNDGDVRFMIQDETGVNNFMKFSNNLGTQFLVDYNGKLYAHEVEVKLGNFPDYVFDDDYQLMPLKNIENFIKENNHLPGVPDATTVINNGLNLGDMDVILLEKIEELTLHLINQEKEIEKLQNELNKLQTTKN